MPKIGKTKIRVGDKDDYMEIEFDVSVNNYGEFTTTLNPGDVDMIKSYGVALGTNGRRNSRQGFFSSNTKKDLVEKVKGVLQQCYTKELIEEKIVIQYSIATTCSFGFTKKGEIVPNMHWREDGELDQDSYWQSGTVDTNQSNSRPTGILMYVKPAHKRTYKYFNGNIKTEYSRFSEFGNSDAGRDQYYLKWLEGICSTNVPRDGKLREIEYTEERAKFFVEMYKSLCKIAHTVAQFEEPEQLLKLADSGKYLMPTNSANDQKKSFDRRVIRRGKLSGLQFELAPILNLTDAMKVLVNIQKEIDVEVELGDFMLGDFIAELNETPMDKRWNHVATILTQVILSKEGLDDRQRIVVEDFLNRKAKEVKLPEGGNSPRPDNFIKSERNYEGFAE